jgi:death on curing protein
VTSEVDYLDLDDLLYLAGEILGDPPPIRDVGLLGSAAARPQTTVMGEDAYPDIWHKAAALLQSIVKNHPLVDGNKRLAWLATGVFLDINGITVTGVPNDDVYSFVMDSAAGNHDVEELAVELVRLVENAHRSLVRVTSVEVIAQFVLRVGFNDGTVREVDLKDELWGPAFEPLRDPDLFAQVRVDEELGTIVWPNGADLDPVVLHGSASPAELDD